MQYSEAYQIFCDIFDNKKSPEYIENLLQSLAQQGETFEEIAGAAQAMREHANDIFLPFETFDVCGTGGSGTAKTFNISTTVAIILASAGVKVAKHGNRAASSKSGSADVLEQLKIAIALSPAENIQQISEKNLTFLFAQVWHPKMKDLMPIRKKIGSRTIFNLLGPLTNPTNPSRQVVGVSDKKYIQPMIEALKLLKKKSAIVLYGEEGIDEASIKGKTYYSYFFDDNPIQSGLFFPEQFGIRSCAREETMAGGTPEENAMIITEILENKRTGNEYNIVIFNAGIAFWIAQKTASIEEGIALAEKQIITGEAFTLLQNLK